MKVLDLFSGIGGFSLGLEATGGFETVAFCEIEVYPFRVLMHHWPEVPIYDDVRTLTAEVLAADGLDRVDVICGGFPCQDISLAGAGAGIEGARSGLWWEYHRLIDEIRPRWAIIENVAALRGRGLGTVLWSLAQIGYDAEWHCIPASAVGTPHRRDRIWIVAYPNGDAGFPRGPDSARQSKGRWDAYRSSLRADLADPDEPRLERWLCRELQERTRERAAWTGGALADAPEPERGAAEPSRVAAAGQGTAEPRERGGLARSGGDWWLSEPNVGRVAHGVPARVDRLRALGNAVVPQIPEMIGRAILAYEQGIT